MNQITLSDDRKTMVITDGRLRADVQSKRPEGFTESDIRKAEKYVFSQTLVEGQVNRARIFGPLIVMVNTGPPTWWRPRVELKNRAIMVGWLRGLIVIGLR